MLTGMRAMDLQGRITYVNAAFCQMTGWKESDLVGRTAPFPYWPDTDHDNLSQLLAVELSGQAATPGGVQMRVKRPDNSLFDARLYVSPLIDARGTQTGWMTAMTDITDPRVTIATIAAATIISRATATRATIAATAATEPGVSM